MPEPHVRHEAAPLAVCLVLAESTGGIGRHVRALAAGLVADGHRVLVVAPAATGARFTFASQPGVEYADSLGSGGLLGSPFCALFGPARHLAAAAAGFDVVHAHGLRAGVTAAVAVRWKSRRLHETRPRLVITFHNAAAGSRGRRMLWRLVGAGLVRAADVTLAVSPDLVETLRTPRRPVERALVAASGALPARNREEVRAELRLADETPLVFGVGRLHAQKGFDVLIESAAGLAGMRPPPVIAIAGEGPCRQQLERLITSAPVDVRLLGDRDDIADLLLAADVVVMPSRWEGWPLAAAEVLAAGRPFVATAVGGLPELVADAASLVPPEDPVGLAEAMKSVLLDPSVASRLAAAAAVRAAELPTVADVTASVVVVYRRALRR